MRIDGLYLNGCATAYPATRVPLSLAVEQGLLHDADESLGDPQVPVHDEDRPAADLAVDALEQTLKETGADPREIDLLLHCGWWHQGWDIWSAAHYVAHRTDALGALPVNLSQGCNAPMAALELATRSMLADPGIRTAAVTASDAMLAPRVDRWNLNYGCVHGDAGTALLVQRGPAAGNSFRILSVASTAAPELEEMNRSGLPPTSGPALRGDGTVDLKAAKKAYLTQYGIQGFTSRSGASLTACVGRALEDAGLTGAEERIRTVTVPRLSRKIFDQVYRPLLGPFFGEHKLRWQGGESAHLGVADVGANIADTHARGELNPGEVTVVVNAGGGYTWSCLVLEAA